MTDEDEARAIEIMADDVWALGKPSLAQRFADVVMLDNVLKALQREFTVTRKEKP